MKKGDPSHFIAANRLGIFDAIKASQPEVYYYSVAIDKW